MDAELVVVVCFQCGFRRETYRTQTGLDVDECPWCGYVGWKLEEIREIVASALASRASPERYDA